MLLTDSDRILKEYGFDLSEDYAKALDLAQFDVGEPVLDVATGSGRMARQLALRGYDALSGDINKDALDKARERLGDLAGLVKLSLLDATCLPFEDGSYAAVTCANAVHELDRPGAAIDEMARVTRDDGKLVLIEFNSRGFELMEEIHKRLKRDRHPHSTMAAPEITRQLESSFERVETFDFGINHVWLATGRKAAGAGCE